MIWNSSIFFDFSIALLGYLGCRASLNVFGLWNVADVLIFVVWNDRPFVTERAAAVDFFDSSNLIFVLVYKVW